MAKVNVEFLPLQSALDASETILPPGETASESLLFSVSRSLFMRGAFKIGQ